LTLAIFDSLSGTANQILFQNGQFSLSNAIIAPGSLSVISDLSVQDQVSFANPLGISSGGTGAATSVPNGVAVASTNGNSLGYVSPGPAGYILQSNGPSSPPSWVNVSVDISADVSGTGGQIVAQNGQLSLANPLISPGDVTVTGTLTLQHALSAANGGTGATSFTANELVVVDPTGLSLTNVPPGMPGLVLQSNGAGQPPSWVNVSVDISADVSGTGGQIVAKNGTLSLASPLITPGNMTITGSLQVEGAPIGVSSGGTGNATLLPNAIMIANSGASALQSLPTGTAGYVLESGGPLAAPSWSPISSLVSVQGTTHQITASTVGGTTTLSLPSSFVVPSDLTVTDNATITGSLSVTGAVDLIQPLPFTSGGTGTTGFTIDTVVFASEGSLQSLPPGYDGYVLTSVGARGPPEWVNISTIAPPPPAYTGTTGEITVTNNVISISNPFQPMNVSVQDNLVVQGSVTFAKPLPVTSGGTNNAAFNAYSVVAANSGGTALEGIPTGTAGYILQTNGNSAPPTWVNISTLIPAAINYTQETLAAITGTTNQIDAVNGVLSLPTTLVVPGSLTVSGTLDGPLYITGNLDMISNTSVLLPPRMTSTQKTAIPSPPQGGVVYDTTQNALNVFDGTYWQPFMTSWQTYACTITATVTNPTYSGTLICRYMVMGKMLFLMMTYTQTVAGTAGSGYYTFDLPSGYSISSQIPLLNTTNGVICPLGTASAWNNGGWNLGGAAYAYSPTTFVIGGTVAEGPIATSGSAIYVFVGSASWDIALSPSVTYAANLQIPIA